MELLITIAYFFLIRLIFFDFKLMKFNLFWKFVVFGLWVAAALTEILSLGQFTPYSKEAFVQSYVVQMAPEYGGLVKEVFITANTPVKKGDPLFQMDPEPWQNRVDEYEAQLASAGTSVQKLGQKVVEARADAAQTQANLKGAVAKYQMIKRAAEKNAVSRIHLEEIEQRVAALKAQIKADKAAVRTAQLAFDSAVGDEHTRIAEVLAKLATAKYNVKNTIIRAPSDGYAANMQLYPGFFARLKKPVMSFVNTEKYWIVAKMDQRGIQHVRPGDHAEVAFDMYPGKVFPAKVVSVTWANGNSQGVPSGQIPTEENVSGGFDFAVRLHLTEENPEYPIRFGASCLVAVFTKDVADFLVLLRQIEIHSESYLKYLFNPF
ncbi:auxiliary transport protein, membrane fusion protein (MFP) family protein [delta proteobacterium NaphS2]|nr:auxiliary transport protein, membrane fusion protein (MFP) family protein [delta proteobacterium NaphS2]